MREKTVLSNITEKNIILEKDLTYRNKFGRILFSYSLDLSITFTKEWG